MDELRIERQLLNNAESLVMWDFICKQLITRAIRGNR